jgi:hypothetical protein
MATANVANNEAVPLMPDLLAPSAGPASDRVAEQTPAGANATASPNTIGPFGETAEAVAPPQPVYLAAEPTPRRHEKTG